MDVTVRRIGPGEGPALARLRLAALAGAPNAFASTYEAEAGRTPADWEERAVAAASGGDRATFLARAGDEPVGLVSSYREANGCFELVSMWVAPGARLSGVGRMLVEEAAAWAASAGAGTLNLWVKKANPAAAALYRRAGFAVVDHCEDELRMTLRLSDGASAARP